jgi:hypothetical protein
MKKQKKEKLLILLAALLTYGGPTYAMYILVRMGVSYPSISALGFSLFLVGIILFLYLFRKGSGTEKA